MAVVGAVIGVREAGIDRQVVIGVRIHQAGRDHIEALGCLAVAFTDLRTEIAGPAADRIDLEQLEMAGGILLPDFELGFFLEDADKDRRTLWHAPLYEQRKQLWRQLIVCFGRQLIAVFREAPIWRQSATESDQQENCANQSGADQNTPPIFSALAARGWLLGSITRH